MLPSVNFPALTFLAGAAALVGCDDRVEPAPAQDDQVSAPVGFGGSGFGGSGGGGFGGGGLKAQTRSSERAGMPPQAARLSQLYRDDPLPVPHAELLDLYARTWHPDWSGSLMLHLAPGHYILDDTSVRGADPRKRGFHLSAYDMERRIPLVVYAPGDPSPGPREQPASLENITATLFDLLEVPRPAGVTAPPLDFPIVESPKLIAVVVMDALSYDHWDSYLARQPGFAALRARGREFTETRLSFMSSSTTVSHAVLGTGQTPARTGIPINHTRTDPGLYVEVFTDDRPDRLLVPTLADLYDAGRGNRPVVVSFCSQSRAAIAMAGHGRDHGGGDADLVVWQQRHSGPFETNADFYAPVGWLRQAVDPQAYLDDLEDRSFHIHEIDSLPDLFRSHHNVVLGERAMLAMMDHEGVGQDDVTDLVFLNQKVLDNVAHRWGADVEEYRLGLDALDAFIPRWIQALQDRAGDDWLLIVTADHGFGPTLAHPAMSGDARRHERGELQEELERSFGSDGGLVFEDIQYLNVYLDEDRLQGGGYSLAQVCEDLVRRDWIVDCLTRPEVELRQLALLP